MRTPRIGLDLDGPCYDWAGTVRYLIRRHHGVDLPAPESWDAFENQLRGIGRPDIWRWLWAEGIELGLFRYGHHVKGSVDGIRDLAKLGAVEIVTHRPAAALRDTLQWASTLPDLSGFHFLSSGEPKSSIACDVYVDDAPHVATEVYEADCDIVVWDMPYNRPSQMTLRSWEYERAYDWDEVVSIVEDLLEEQRMDGRFE